MRKLESDNKPVVAGALTFNRRSVQSIEKATKKETLVTIGQNIKNITGR